ncbi:hypothetical protein [Haloferula sargassicola]|uniref:Uncharacterized protein n=1 Tax=Haloferula sargassicola TaxID=490096 RepID=A0ABP9UUC0_9BACT
MKTIITTIISLPLLLPLISAEEESADMRERERIVELMEARVEAGDQRIVELANEIQTIHHRLNAKLERLVGKLARLEDSPDSGFRLGKAKIEVIEGLEAAVEEFVAQRRTLEQKLRAGTEERAVGDVQMEIDHLDAEVVKHLDQVVKLSLSFARDEHVKKYESVGGSGYYTGGYGWFEETVQISDEWRQNRHNRTMDREQREQVTGILDRAIARCEASIRRAETALENDNMSSEERQILQTEIDAHRSMLDKRKAQKDELLFEPQPETSEVGRDLARELEKAVDEGLAEVQEDIRKLVVVHRKFREEQADLTELKSLLAARKEWLEENRQPKAGD